MIRLYFIRHGETQYNIQEKVQGWNDSPLTETGIYQARCTGYGLRNTEFTKVYSGDSLRQINTAVTLMKENNHPAEIIADKRFREMCYGKYEDGSYIEMLGPLFDIFHEPYGGYEGLYRHFNDLQIAEELFIRDETNAFEGLERVWKRVSEALDMICSTYEEGSILISTSSFVICTVIHKLFPEFIQPRLVDNASVTIVSYDGFYHLLDYNNTSCRKEGERHFPIKTEK